MNDTIYALSSGQPPAGIAVVRISGPQASSALQALLGRIPPPRRASVGTLKDPSTGEILDHALTLWFPGPATATGEDVVELHLHGGRAIISTVLEAIGRIDGLRLAEPGGFTRRAFENGKIDLSEAEGLADLLSAETKSQKRAALLMASGHLSRKVSDWRGRLLKLSAVIETLLDFSDEGDVTEELPASWGEQLSVLIEEIEALVRRPRAERLKDGVRVAIAGPPNAGKSTLLNALVQREAAITSDVAGTTRDVIEVPVSIAGVPFLFLDTAGIRTTEEQVEQLGIGRAMQAMKLADIILWLGHPSESPQNTSLIQIAAKADLGLGGQNGLAVSALTGAGMDDLLRELVAVARTVLPSEGDLALNERQAGLLSGASAMLRRASQTQDLLLMAEELRAARVQFDRLTGHAGVEDMLDTLFGSFCIGK